MNAGIDLGTTNSALAAFDGEAVTVVESAQGGALTPSVVRIDARGQTSVGRRAQRFLESDPGNTRAEFKRLMGTAERLRFEGCGRELLPEELSAEVLRALLADARDRLGFAPRAAVISTPALFELPQNHATVRAGKLAGLEEVQLLQEPIASAIAAGWRADAPGLWLVYDLGGGTLDVSLLETKDGFLRVVDHGGDNFLGGRDLDAALVDWALGRIRDTFDVPALARSNPASRRAIAKLKAACEAARIDLSRAERSTIAVPELTQDAGGMPVDVDLEIARAELEALIAPLVERSLDVCRSVLSRNHVEAEAVGKVVFVGGPTLTPLVRQLVGDAFGGRVAEGIDPMTVVARGAALYAATAGLDARPRVVAPPTKGLGVRLEHPAVTADAEPFVAGRFLPAPGESLPATVRVEREDGGFASPDVAVSAEGGFVAQVKLERGKQSRFRVRAFDAAGHEVALRSPGLSIVHGMSVADPPLSRTVGVALADDTVHVYFAKGTPLPARRSFVHQTVQAVPAGDADVLRIPVVQGEFERAHRNRLIGTLQVAGVRRDLPAGTRVEVTLRLDRSGQLEARADIPVLGQTFDDVVQVLVPTASPDVLAREVAGAEARLVELRRRSAQRQSPEIVMWLGVASPLLAEASAGLEAAQGGDADAGQRTARLLLDLGAALDSVEQELAWPELEAEADDAVRLAVPWVASFGTKNEQQLLEEALEAVRKARRAREAAELERQLKVVRAMGDAAFARDPRTPHLEFDWYASNVGEALDLPKAHALVARGREARSREDAAEIRTINRQLADLFPSSPEARRRSFGSGVR